MPSKHLATIPHGFGSTVSSLSRDLLLWKEILKKYPNGYLYVQVSSELFLIRQ